MTWALNPYSLLTILPRAHQYRHRFKIWRIRKRTLTTEKEAIYEAIEKRKHAFASTSDLVIEQGGRRKGVDAKQLRRYLKQQMRYTTVEAHQEAIWATVSVRSYI